MPTHEYYLKNKERITLTGKKWRENNAEKVKLDGIRYRLTHKKSMKIKNQKLYLKNKDKYVDKLLQYRYKISLKKYNELLNKQGGRCAI